MNSFYKNLAEMGVIPRKIVPFCVPANKITGGQVARVIVKYLKDHPERLHENETFLAIQALQAAFPCK